MHKLVSLFCSTKRLTVLLSRSPSLLWGKIGHADTINKLNKEASSTTIFNNKGQITPINRSSLVGMSGSDRFMGRITTLYAATSPTN